MERNDSGGMNGVNGRVKDSRTIEETGGCCAHRCMEGRCCDGSWKEAGRVVRSMDAKNIGSER